MTQHAGGFRWSEEDLKVINVPQKADACEHVSQFKPVMPSAVGCEDCMKMGDPWVNLRLCMTCGHVGCCDASKNKHATKHFHATQHPVIMTFMPGEDWLFCYIHNELMK